MKYDTSETIAQAKRTFAPIAKSIKPTSKVQKPAFPPDQDIILWLSTNAPSSFDELIDLRYSLYHRCNAGLYRLKRLNDEEFMITGRNGSLHIISNQARRLLLTKLRGLAKENGWRGALPKLKAGRQAKDQKPITPHRQQAKIGTDIGHCICTAIRR